MITPMHSLFPQTGGTICNIFYRITCNLPRVEPKADGAAERMFTVLRAAVKPGAVCGVREVAILLADKGI